MKATPPLLWQTDPAIVAALRDGDGRGVKVAIIDSGVETSHPDLAGLQLADDVVVEDDLGLARIHEGSGTDLFGHGTAIAAILLKHAPAITLGSFRVLNARLGSRNHLVRVGARLAIERGYHVLNCSFGCRDDYGRYAMLYKDWLDLAYKHHVHVVTACNNDDFRIQEWPGFFHSCVNVNIATEQADGFTYRPDHLVEFAAAGTAMDLPWKDGGRRTVTGSSFATPVITALLARLLGRFPGLTPVQAKALLQLHARPWQAPAPSPSATTSTTPPPPAAIIPPVTLTTPSLQSSRP